MMQESRRKRVTVRSEQEDDVGSCHAEAVGAAKPKVSNERR